MSKIKDFSVRGVCAGAAIGIAGFAYLAVGGVFGALLFSFGLVSIYVLQLKLFTGMAGNETLDAGGLGRLLAVLALNFLGAWLVSLIGKVSPLDIQSKAIGIISGRLETGWWQCALLAIPCGFIVDEAVYAWKQKKWILPTVLGVCIFIMCGFCHCIADAFYLSLLPLSFVKAHFLPLLACYSCIAAGNFIGCNLRRLLAL